MCRSRPPRGVVLTALLSASLPLPPAVASGQQVADPTFDASVARPAYTDRYPRVLFDEGHQNTHSSDGRYKPFVSLVRNDGSRVTANKETFAKQSLDGFDILVIGNAATAEGRNRAEPAFTTDECDAVPDWVRAGGPSS